MTSINGLTTGIQTDLTYIDATGVQHFATLESFMASENADVPEYVAIDGVTRFNKFYKGWTGSFVIQRTSSALDNFLALNESAYYLGGLNLPGFITQTIVENNGTLTQFQFTNVVLKLDDGGHYSGTDIVKQTVSFSCSRRLPLI